MKAGVRVLSNASQLIVGDLRRLGVESGDSLLVMADVRYMRLPRDDDGKRPSDYATELMSGLRDAVGSRGTLLFLTFTRTAWKLLPIGTFPFFDADVAPTTGSLAELATRQPDSRRSSHPTNSVTALGANAEMFCRFHSPESHAFRPVETLMNLGGKMLTIGCVDTTPGFSTVHLAQFHLGLSKRTLLRNRGMVGYRADLNQQQAIFRRRDIPGCSLGFGKMYETYRSAGILKEGRVAKAPSMLIGAQAAYALDYETLKDDPESLLCDDPDCKFCRGLVTYGKSSPARYWLRRTGQEVRLRAGRVEQAITSGRKTGRS